MSACRTKSSRGAPPASWARALCRPSLKIPQDRQTALVGGRRSSTSLECLKCCGQLLQLCARVFTLRHLRREACRRLHVALRAEQRLSRCDLVPSTGRLMGVQGSQCPPCRILAPAAHDPLPLPLQFLVERGEDLPHASGSTTELRAWVPQRGPTSVRAPACLLLPSMPRSRSIGTPRYPTRRLCRS